MPNELDNYLDNEATGTQDAKEQQKKAQAEYEAKMRKLKDDYDTQVKAVISPGFKEALSTLKAKGFKDSQYITPAQQSNFGVYDGKAVGIQFATKAAGKNFLVAVYGIPIEFGARCRLLAKVQNRTQWVEILNIDFNIANVVSSDIIHFVVQSLQTLKEKLQQH